MHVHILHFIILLFHHILAALPIVAFIVGLHMYMHDQTCFCSNRLRIPVLSVLSLVALFVLFTTLQNCRLLVVLCSGVVVVERLERSLQFLFSRVERRSSSCFTCFLSILLISCRNYHLT